MAITASSWQVVDPAGVGDLTVTGTTQLWPLGFRVRAKDLGSTDRGFGEFVYAKGVASTVAGDAVVIDESDWTTVRTVAASVGLLGVALSANVASQYGWYQVSGVAVVTAGTVADNGKVYTTATDGSLDDAQVDSQQIINCLFRGATDTGQALIQLNNAWAGTDDQLA